MSVRTHRTPSHRTGWKLPSKPGSKGNKPPNLLERWERSRYADGFERKGPWCKTYEWNQRIAGRLERAARDSIADRFERLARDKT